MKKITINVTFNMWGHGSINIIPSTYKEWDPTVSSSQDYNLDPGDYTILYDTVTGNGGSISVTGITPSPSDTLSKGMYSGHFRITI